MKFSVSSEALTRALRKVSVALESKGEMDSYANIRLEAGNNMLVVSVVGKLSFCVEARLSADTGANYVLCGVSGKLLTDIIASFKDQPVFFTLENTILKIEIGKNVFKLNIFDPTSFVPGPKFDVVKFEQIDMTEFFRRTSKVSFCLAKGSDMTAEMPKYMSVGINSYHFVATNGLRMAIHENKILGQLENKTHLLSGSMLDKLEKIYKDTGESGGIFIDESTLYMASQGIFASARLNSDQYPNYTAIIPKTPFEPVTFDRKELMDVLYRTILLAEKEHPHAMFSFTPAGEFKISSTSKAGEAVQSIGCMTSVNSECAVNAKYFLEALEHMSIEKITMEYRGPENIILLTEQDYVNVIVPILLKRA